MVLDRGRKAAQFAGRLTSSGFRNARAAARTLSRTARVPLLTLIDAREMASMSDPTTKRSNTLLPLNGAANSAGSTEK